MTAYSQYCKFAMLLFGVLAVGLEIRQNLLRIIVTICLPTSVVSNCHSLRLVAPTFYVCLILLAELLSYGARRLSSVKRVLSEIVGGGGGGGGWDGGGGGGLRPNNVER